MIKLIYFTECPNAQVVKDLLQELGISFLEVNQDFLAMDDEMKKVSSPSLMSGTSFIIGGLLSGSGGCSLGDFSRQSLIQKFKAIRNIQP